MATTKRLTATNGFYGHSGNGSYSNSAANHLFVGKSPGTSNYRSRMTFPSLRSAVNIGDSRINITKMILHLYRNDGGPTTVTAGSSVSSAWGAARAGTGSAEIAASTGWKSIDVTDCAEAVAGYSGNWYMHLTGSADHRIRFNGTGGSNRPYLDVTWEYVAATIKGDQDSVGLGESVRFTITREENDASFELGYSIGEMSGDIASGSFYEDETTAVVVWTPPTALASEITDDDIGTIEILLTVYDSGGAVIRTERYYQTVTVPASFAPKVSGFGTELVGGLGGYALTGRSHLILAPVIDMNGAYGASVVSVAARIVNGGSEQSAAWTQFTETEPGIFACAPVQSAVLTEAGEAVVTLTVTDSRGMTVEAVQSLTVCAYAPPVIGAFSAERYSPVYDENEEIGGYEPDDLGGHVWISAEASVSEVAPDGVQLNALAWRIEAVNPATGETLTASGEGAQSLVLVRDMTLFPGAVSEGDTWNYVLTLTDTAGAAVAQYASVQPGWANFALAASRRGAAFGGIPHGTAEKPMLESWYRGYFYAGIHGVNVFSYDEAETGGSWVDGKPIFRKTVRFDPAVITPVDGYYSVDVSGLGIETAWLTEPVIRYTDESGAEMWQSDHYMGTKAYGIMYVSGGLLTLRMGSTQTLIDAYVTLNYTKGA